MKNSRGILLVNLGSPDSPSVKDVRRYLGEFLMDERVLDAPYLVRKGIVSLIIKPFRSSRSAEAYQSIWWDEGSPLIVISRRVQDALQKTVDMPVELGMSYGNPSIPAAVRAILDHGIDELLLIPMYPHYAMSTYETAVVAVQRAMEKAGATIPLTVRPPYYDHPAYIQALAASVKDYVDSDYDHLLFSYHGLPERHLRKTDPTGSHCLSAANCCTTPSVAHKTCYRAQVYATTEALAETASIPKGKYSVAFQSRLGRDKWLEPATTNVITELAAKGVKRLLVICPAFVSDCLETLEEIGMRGQETFVEAGGEELKLIPCLNDHPVWIEALRQMCHG